MIEFRPHWAEIGNACSGGGVDSICFEIRHRPYNPLWFNLMNWANEYYMVKAVSWSIPKCYITLGLYLVTSAQWGRISKIRDRGLPLYPVRQQLGELGSRLLMTFEKNFNGPNHSHTSPSDIDFPWEISIFTFKGGSTRIWPEKVLIFSYMLKYTLLHLVMHDLAY